MPTYEYFCSKCREKFDYFQAITEKPLAKCPHCKKVKPQRLISSGAGLIFKGSGFYITDYKKSRKEEGGKRKEERKEKTVEMPAEKKSETKSAKD